MYLKVSRYSILDVLQQTQKELIRCYHHNSHIHTHNYPSLIILICHCIHIINLYTYDCIRINIIAIHTYFNVRLKLYRYAVPVLVVSIEKRTYRIPCIPNIPLCVVPAVFAANISVHVEPLGLASSI